MVVGPNHSPRTLVNPNVVLLTAISAIVVLEEITLHDRRNGRRCPSERDTAVCIVLDVAPSNQTPALRAIEEQPFAAVVGSICFDSDSIKHETPHIVCDLCATPAVLSDKAALKAHTIRAANNPDSVRLDSAIDEIAVI
jgi:hypothetical protein